MPPSPAMRVSPGRELRAKNHKRGHSLESSIFFREKDDDLALFNEVQNRERDNFLLQSNDDFEDTFSTKLRYFSDYKLGISIPSRGESSELLNADGEKNDYDWLLTPPDTPLFRSLDDEPPPINIAQRGRPRSQPISISRSSTMEKSHRSSRGSASPNRLSPSPRSGNSNFQSRGSPSSAPHSSPTPSIRHGTPMRRPSPPPSKPSTPAPRSSTPTPRKLSTSSSAVASSRVRGTSPVNTSRGNSASPKIRAWQTNIPGFSSEAPPNLRTSLVDRPASYVRGSSPSSRNGRDSSCRSGRQSMSPTASRSVGSSHSHDRDRLSSHSKGSVASSGDDDADSLQSIRVGSSRSRSMGAFSNNKALALSKKPTRTVSSNSGPKRYVDLAPRQMDNRKSPQNMFRPLLSSVPSSTFHAGKASAAPRTMISRTSLMSTRSNTSSGQATSGARDTEGSNQYQEDVTSEFVKAPDPDVQDEIFMFDKVDASNEEIRHGIYDGLPSSGLSDFDGGPRVDSQLDFSENFTNHETAMTITATSQDLDMKSDFEDVDGLKNMLSCFKCGCKYRAIESIEGDLNFCPDCRRSNVHLYITTPMTPTIVAENSPRVSPKSSEERESFDALGFPVGITESPYVTSMGESRVGQEEKIIKEGQKSYSEPSQNSLSENVLALPLVEKGYQRRNPQLLGQPTISYSISDCNHQNLKIDVSEGAGISVLLKRSSSGKGPIVQSRTFSATSISCDDLSYSVNSMRSSIGFGSISASSSVDLGLARRTETPVQRQLSGKKSDFENCRYDGNTKHRRTGSSLSGTSSHAFQALGLAASTNEESTEVSVADEENDDVDARSVAPEEQFTALEKTEMVKAHIDIESKYNDSTCSSFEEFASNQQVDDLTNKTRNISNMEVSGTKLGSFAIEEVSMLNSCEERADAAEVPTQSSLDTIVEIEVETGYPGSSGSQSDVISRNSNSSIDELQEPCVPTASDKDITALVAESDISDLAHGSLEKPSIMVGGQGGAIRNLEEATNTIVFCRSIVHNLAYEAATTAIEKENSFPLEGFRPTVTVLGESNSDRKDSRGRMVGKRTSKSQKTRQRRIETDTKPCTNLETAEKTDVSAMCIVGVPNKVDSMKPQKLESKCNCTIM